jgi:N-acetylmuramoyl-L-alanine amidase
LKTRSSQRGLRWGALLLLVALSGLPAHARTHHTESWARERFAGAERMREALNGRPPADRTRRDYQRVVNSYRNVYYGAPTSTKADPSVVAVAETLVEMGRRFDDNKILNEAIAQYRFLRREYPGSKYRCDALFTIGEIYKDDLNDPEQARTVFEEFLHRYPHNRLVEDAQQAIVELDRQAEADKTAEAERKAEKETPGKSANPKDSGEDTDGQANGAGQEASDHSSDHHSGRLPRVTGIRHWSTPDYTRVAIDLESEVKFASQRIAHPDRIFFDLRDTKLASTLVGKSFDVDDGFLKKIRVAQFQPGRTRVVLEVDDLSDYDAFLLPNPYRLIVDIHGKDAHGKQARTKLPRDAATADVEAGPKVVAKNDPATSNEKAALRGQGRPDENESDDSDAVATSDAAVTRPGVSKPATERSEPGTPVAEAGNKPPRTAAKPSTPASQNRASNGRRHCDTQDPASSAPCPAVHSAVDPKTGVKRVVVEADDADSSPVQVAKLEAPMKHEGPAAAASRKLDRSTDPDAAAVEAKPATDSPASGHAKGETSSRPAPDRSVADRDVHEAKPTARGDRSLIRALGLKIGKIVIDPGHGGHDTGTIGPNGLEEKDLVLDVGRRLGKLLEARLGAEVVYTRKDDTFIPLETRTAIANQQRADLFVSIHANSSDDPDARGVETYYLNFTSSPEALEVAARENAVSEKSIYELQDLVKKIALKEKIEESREFAGDVQGALHSGLAAKSPGIRNRGVKKAPFIVLIGANMPSILAEISFVSNPGDEHRLETGEYRQRIAESLYRGIAKYVNGLSGVKVASKMDKPAGQ